MHPDEPTIVDQTIDMLRRHSWEANVYNRPDHFEIKCNAILFYFFSKIKYNMPAFEAFAEHKMSFYKLARLYTTFFGTAMIPLVAIFIGKLLTGIKKKYKQIAQIIASLLTAFSCIFIEHSAYATPDVVLAFFVLLFAYILLLFVIGNEKCAFICAGIIGVGITIKYPAAILCIPLAVSVMYIYGKEKKYIKILQTGFLCITIVVTIAFIIAPNLFTNYEQTIHTFITEARPNHLGADGLGFLGNCAFYVRQSIKDQSWLSFLFVLISIVYLISVRNKRLIVLLVGFVFWICMSVLSLHWQRWGTPMYIFYIVLSAVGIAATLSYLDLYRNSFFKHKWIICCCKYVLMNAVVIWIVSLGFSSVCFTVSRTLPDVRNIALSYVNENHIDRDEALSEGYTPFYPGFFGDCVSSFLISDNSVKPKIEFATKKYLIISNSFRNRYMNERHRYPSQCALYDAIEQQYSTVYSIDGSFGNWNNDLSKGLVSNIGKSIEYLSREKQCCGGAVTIFDLAPHVITIKDRQTGKYLSSKSNDQDSELIVSNKPYEWIMYENGNNTLTLISNTSGMAICVNAEGLLSMQQCTGDDQQQWVKVQNDNVYGFIMQNHLMLSCVDGSVCLKENTGDSSHGWIIDE